MPVFLHRLVRLAAQRIVQNPQTRDAAIRTVKALAGEAKLISGEKDKARAAGRSLRRVLNSLQGRSGS